MEKGLRTFVAIEFKPEAKLLSCWNEIVRQTKMDSIKWVNDKTLHLTLHFLGNTPISLVEKIKSDLHASVEGFGSFSCSLKSLGYFGNPIPKVVWVGIDKSEKIVELQKKVEQVVNNNGFESDIRGFNPHITLGRVKFMNSVQPFRELIEKYNGEPFQENTVDKLIFYRSDLRPTGPIYTPIDVIKL
ncbi:MAG TPA: RNA 2',3'-cyclic phosphodiesterase [Tenuifilaceae bacterium]|nr:RNA 2',3'-cyclic phosphodiesterase [Tenuifilaceae bacterium]